MLANLKIRSRLVLAIGVPVLMLLAFTGFDLMARWTLRTDVMKLQSLAEGVATISNLIHELQRERGASAVFVGSRGTQLRDGLADQRKRTDERQKLAVNVLASLATHASGDFLDGVEKATKAVAALSNKRDEINAFSISATASNVYFSETIAKLLFVTSEIAKVSRHGDVTMAIVAYVNFMQGKELAGQERATGAAGISAGRFEQAGYLRVLSLATAQDAYFAAFAATATASQNEFFARTIAGPVIDVLAKMRQIVQSGGLTGEMTGLDGKSWFDTTTQRIDLLKTVEDRIAADLAALTNMIVADASRGILTMGVIIVIAPLFGFGMAWVIGRGITGPLTRIAGVLGDLAQDRVVDVPHADRTDEIGSIAKATEVFRTSIAEKVINFRVRSSLDVVRSNVMIADENYNIMYMNSTLTAMMREAEAELRKALPSFDSSTLIGTNMDIFHKNTAHQRGLLDGLSGSHEAHISIGALKFHLVATAVVDRHGSRAGTVVEWRNETTEKAIEQELDRLVNAAVAGDFSQRVPLDGKQGFMLSLAKLMNSLCENTANALEDLVRMFGKLAEGDLTQRITADYQGMFGRLKADANAMADQISTTISDIKASASEVTNASQEISTSTTDLSQRTEEQAASLEQTSASLEEISATVKKNAENAQVANQSANETCTVAEHGGTVVGEAVKAMSKIEESSRKISDIIGVIDEIARQTNLLALNAAVEAARAGEAGRGFAVVASEVRSLAQRSSQAAKDITNLITNSTSQVKEGVELVNRTGAALDEIVTSIKKVADVISAIAAANVEQANGLDQVNKAMTQMDEVTQQNSALVEENAATAKTLQQQAAAMDERVAFFRVDGAAGGAAARPPKRPTVAPRTAPRMVASR